MPGQNSFETSELEISGNGIFVRHYGKGPAILLVHGFPRASLMWRFVAPKLAETHTVISVDLRASGRSGVFTPTQDHFPYSKRAMAKELVDLMAQLGFLTFTAIGHDRGGRVSYRMALLIAKFKNALHSKDDPEVRPQRQAPRSPGSSSPRRVTRWHGCSR